MKIIGSNILILKRFDNIQYTIQLKSNLFVYTFLKWNGYYRSFPYINDIKEDLENYLKSRNIPYILEGKHRVNIPEKNILINEDHSRK